MKKRLSILLALSMLFVGVFVQAAAASEYTLSEMSFIDDQENDITTDTATTGINKTLTLMATFAGSGTGGTCSGTFTLTVPEGLTVQSAAVDSSTSYLTLTSGGDSTYTYSGTGLSSSAKTPKINFVVKASAAGTYAFVVAGVNGDSEAVEATITLTVSDPVAPTMTPTGLDDVAKVGTALGDASNPTIYITCTDTTSVAPSGFSVNGLTLAGSLDGSGRVVITGTPAAGTVGSHTFKITATSESGLTTTETFTLVVQGDAPAVHVWGLADSEATTATDIEETEELSDETDISQYYDPDNSALYVGKDASLVAAQTASSTSPLSFKVTGNSQSMSISGKIAPSGSGLTFTVGNGEEVTGETWNSVYPCTLSGSLKKAGEYLLTIKAVNAQATTTKVYKLTVLDVPKITDPTSTKKVVTWGKAFELPITATNATSFAISAPDATIEGVNSGTTTLDSTGLTIAQVGTESDAGTKTNFLVDTPETGTEPGTLTLTLSGTDDNIWKPGAGSTLINPTEGTSTGVTAVVNLVAKSGTGTGAMYTVLPITLTFKPASPTVTAIENIDELAYSSTALTNSIAIATAEGPGYLSWDVAAINSKLPAGLEVDTTTTESSQVSGATDETAYTSTLYISGTPRAITPSAGTSVTLKATPYKSKETDGTWSTALASAKSGTQTIKVTTSDYSDGPELAETSSTRARNVLPSGHVKKDDTAFSSIYTDLDKTEAYTVHTAEERTTRETTPMEGEVELFAEPGPLTWKATNLPANVKLVPDTGDTRYAYLQFSDANAGFKSATTITVTTADDETTYTSPYTITITNPNLSTKTATLTESLVVWDTPTASALSKTSLTVDKSYSGKATTTNTPTSYTVNLKTYDSTAQDNTSTPMTDGSTYPVSGGSSSLTWDEDTLTLSGTLDRIPQVKNSNGSVVNGFILGIKPTNFAGDGDEKETFVSVKGVKPKLDNAAITLSSGGSETIKTSAGTQTINMVAYITAADAKKLFGYEGNTSVDFTGKTAGDADTYGFGFTDGADGTGTLAFTNPSDTTYAFKNLPVVVAATNLEGSVNKTYKVTVEGDDPAWGNPSGETFTTEGVATVLAGKAITDTYIAATITSPYEIKVSPSTEKNGLTPTVSGNTVTFTGTPTDEKETKTVFTLTATNTSTKQKDTKKLTFHALVPPTITSTTDKLSKTVQLGKKISIKPAAKGSKTITWAFNDDSATTKDDLSALGINFDSTKGSLTGTPTAPTTADGDATTFAAKSVTLEAQNSSLSSYIGNGITAWPTITFEVGVKGAKTKVTTKNIEVTRNETRSALSIVTNPLYSAASVGGAMTFELTGQPAGITIDSSTGELTIDDSELIATKGTTATVTVNNAGTTATGKVKFIVNDATPEIADFTIDDITAQEKAKVPSTKTVELETGNCTGDTKIKWAIKTAPRRAQAKIKGSGESATLTITVPKGVYNSDKTDSTAIEQTIVITATNTKTKKVGEKEVTFNIIPCTTSATATAEDATFDAVADKTADAKAEEKAATGEGEVKFGKTRTAPTAAQLGAVQKVLGDGYVIAAVLPEIEVTADGQYDFEVDLDEKVAAGAELVWFAFPESGKETEDDEIVDFYTKAGEDTKVVPEDHVLVVSPWLNAEVKYEPVIAVKVDAAEAEAVDAESVKEAAEEQAAE